MSFPKSEIFFGPFQSAGENCMFHWRKDCPQFPKGKCISVITSTKPEESRLCLVCEKLDVIDASLIPKSSE